MSIKKIFSSKFSDPLTSKDMDNIVQSQGFTEEKIKENARVIPNIDLSIPSNFAKFGSAKKYYEDSFAHIYKTYPYDGSFKEKAQWKNESSYIDLYVLDNLYPKTTGYLTLGSSSWNGSVATSSFLNGGFQYSSSAIPEYIKIFGGPHTDAVNPNVYSDSKNKKSNLSLEHLNGNTIEFWFKQESSTPKTYCLFDLWNGKDYITDSDYVRVTIENMNLGGFNVTYVSGTSGLKRELVTTSSLPSFDINEWHHYAFVFKSSSCELYINGDFINTVQTSSAITSSVHQSGLNANIGAYRTSPITTNALISNGSGSVYGSFDEFRFWKKARTAKEIYQNQFVHVGGGTNTDDYANDLGVYLKFNEGVTGYSNYDAVCLDYSGRLSNGTIINYTSNIRSTSSAIEERNASYTEEKDPILYPIHPTLSSSITLYQNSGSVHDEENNTNLYKGLPYWITKEADDKNDPELSNFTQILASYLDTLHLQIENFGSIKDVYYPEGSQKVIPFFDRAINSYGFELEDIFVNTNLFENILSRNDETLFSDSLQNLKNLIYKNLYNNLSYIYKSKGTEKSFRNLLRCFGIDEELVKINIYSNNLNFKLQEKRTYSTYYKKYADFNHPDRFEASVYQRNVQNESDELSYINYSYLSSSGFYKFTPFTLESEVIFPKKFDNSSPNFFDAPFTQVSLFGLHSASNNQTNYTWSSGPDHGAFTAYAIKTKENGNDVYFKLVASGFGNQVLTSSVYKNVYNNEKWNFAVKIKNEKQDAITISDDLSNSSYVLEFYGVNSYLDEVKSEFLITASLPYATAIAGLASNKRVFAGAEYSDFDKANILYKSDVKISSVRYWISYLNDDIIKDHSFDVSAFGGENPTGKALTFSNLSVADSLVLNWDFSNVTGSDSNGTFVITDLTSGSLTETRYPQYYSELIKNKHKGYGDNFTTSDIQVTNTEYVYNAKNLLPESIIGEDMLKVVNEQDIGAQFSREAAPSDYFFSIEKSMYRVISDDMLQMFSSISDFNNLICNPINSYQNINKSLENVAKEYFKKVNNTPDQEKFIEFYKWIDSSILKALSNLIPASAVFSNNLSNTIESHALERNVIPVRMFVTDGHVAYSNITSSVVNQNTLRRWTPPF